MKPRRKQNISSVQRGPAAFDFTLLSELYIHREGDEILDFGGAVGEQVKPKYGAERANPAPFHQVGTHDDVVNNGTFIFLQNEPASPVARDFPVDRSPVGESQQMMRIEERGQHIWLVVQPNEAEAPFARNFNDADRLFKYLTKHDIPFPSSEDSKNSDFLPTTTWIDIQRGLERDSGDVIKTILSKFPVSQDVVDNCLYIAGQDRVDTSYMLNTDGSPEYLFLNVSCTPLEEEPQPQTGDPFAPRAPLIHNINTTKSIMEMRFDAVFKEDHTLSAEPVVLAVIAFRNWIITVHEEPFAEMDDLLRMIQMRCFPEQFNGKRLWHPAEPSPGAPKGRFTSPFVLTSLFQISVGHHVDSVTLAEAINKLGDKVFTVKDTIKEQEKALLHITVVRRCCGECSTEVSRKENIVTTLLQPQFKQHFLVSDPYYREQLKISLDHLRRIQLDLGNCRDTVALYNWYHNISIQWFLLRRGNRALRMLLLITECANIIYPVLMIQTLYAMNVPVPFDSEGDPPSTSYVPFFVLLAIFCVYCFWCGRAVMRMFKRKQFKTQLLA